MRYLIPALLLLAGCTVVYVEHQDNGSVLNVENKTTTADNGGTAMTSDRRDPTINAAIPWWTP